MRRAKIGLIDGPGNHPAHVAATVLAIEGMLAQAAPGKASYPDHRPGALLVHCRGGRSRSLAVLALWLSRSDPQGWGPAPEALDRLRHMRGLGPDQPNAAMLDSMRAALPLLASIPRGPWTGH